MNNAQLVNIGSADENDFIEKNILGGNLDYWIGLTDSETEGNWKWANGATLTGYNNWASYQPNDYKGQDCAAIKGATQNSGKWHDVSCYFTDQNELVNNFQIYKDVRYLFLNTLVEPTSTREFCALKSLLCPLA